MALAALRRQGVDPIELIRAIREACNIILREAKEAFENSDAWSDIRVEHDSTI